MAWTTDMIDNLKKLWKKGLTTNEIAKELGVSKNSIVGKVHRLNLTSRPSPIKKKDDEFDTAVVSTSEEPEVEKKPAKSAKKAQKEPEIIQQVDIQTIEITAPVAPKNKRGIKLSELDSHTCRWPIGDPKDDGFCFCGAKVRTGQTYCDEHAAIAYVKPGKK